MPHVIANVVRLTTLSCSFFLQIALQRFNLAIKV
jgi:hypothetical protein